MAMLHGKNNVNILHKKENLFPEEKGSIVPAMQHGCCAKPVSEIELTPLKMFGKNATVYKSKFAILIGSQLACTFTSDVKQRLKGDLEKKSVMLKKVRDRTTRQSSKVFIWDNSGYLNNIGLVMEQSDWLILVIDPLN